MRPLWALLANNGGDLVLNGHTHDMEAYAPLNASLAMSQPDSHMVQLVAGSGGHAFYPSALNDPRGIWQALRTPGALYVTAVGGSSGTASRLDWAFKDASGSIVTTTAGPGQGSVSCGGSVDTDPPTAPGKPTGSSAGNGSISISWAASTDASPPITYKVYRDGDLVNAVGTTTSTTFTDTNLTPGSQHTYTIGATDKLGNGPTFGPASDPITVSAAIFSDDFSTGDFSKWSGVTRMTIDPTTGGVAPPSAQALTSAQTGFAFENLSGTFSQLCMSANVNVPRSGEAHDVVPAADGGERGGREGLRERLGDPLREIRRVGCTSSSRASRSGPGGTTSRYFGTVGTSGTWDLYRDGVKIVNAWPANTGTTPIGRVEIGNAQAVTSTINFDDVVVA